MNKALRTTFFLSLVSIIYVAYTNSGGPGYGYTNAPSDANCTSCHGGTAITSGYRHSKIKLETNWHGGGYLPDSTYSISITFKDTLKGQSGFQITALDNSNNPVGVITNVGTRVSSGTKVTAGKTRYYAEHTSTGSINVKNDSNSWQIKWKAPNTNAGPVKFYVSVLSGNQSGSNAGDIVYTKTFTVNLSTLLPKGKVTTTSSLCQNSPIKLSLTSVSGSPTSYFWNLAGGSPATETIASPTVTYNTNGTKTIIARLRNQYGYGYDTAKLIIKQGPGSIEISENNGTDILTNCLDDSLTLNVKNIRTGETYLWNPSNILSGSIKIKNTGKYAVSSTLTSNGCSRTSSELTVKQFQKYNMNIDSYSDTVFCSEDDSLFLKLSSDANILSSEITNAANGNVLSTGIKNHAFGFSNLSGVVNININGKDSNGCKLITKPFKVTVTKAEEAPVNTINNIKINKLQFNWSAIKSTTGYEVKIGTNPWKSTLSAGLDTFYLVDSLLPSTTISMKVRAKFSGTCAFSKTATFSAKTLDCLKPTLTYKLDSAFCVGDTLKLKVTSSDPNNTILYVNNVKLTGLGYTKVISTSNVSENVILKDSINYCLFDTVKIRINANTYPTKSSITNAPIIEVCTNIGIQYDVKFFANSAGAQKYQWVKNGTNVLGFTSGTDAKFRAANLDKIRIDAINGRCITKSDEAEVRFVGEIPCTITATRIGLTSNYKLVSNPKSYVINKWGLDNLQLPDSIIKTNSDSFIFNFAPYKGKTKIINFEGEKVPNCKCSGITQVNLNVLKTKGTLVSGILYPNPAQGVLNFNTNLKGDYKIISMSGAVVIKGTTNSNVTQINVADITTGVYQFIFNSTNGQEVETIIIK